MNITTLICVSSLTATPPSERGGGGGGGVAVSGDKTFQVLRALHFLKGLARAVGGLHSK